MRTYTFGEKRGLRMPSKWLVAVIVLTVGLLVYDYISYGNLMTYVFTGIK